MTGQNRVEVMRHPTRYDRKAYHAKYGIINWLNKIGIIDDKQQDEIIDQFLEQRNFVLKADGKGDANRIKASFISNRFGEFTKYVMDNKPAPVAQTW